MVQNYNLHVLNLKLQTEFENFYLNVYRTEFKS